MKYILAFGALLGAASIANADALPNVEKNGNKVMVFTKEQAVDHCTAKGKKLPTVRQLAVWSQEHGAIGVRESANKLLAYPSEVSIMQQYRFEAVYLHFTRLQTVVDFYFDPTGFKAPKRTTFGTTRIWTRDTRHVQGGDAYTFTPGYPAFRADSSEYRYAAVCI